MIVLTQSYGDLYGLFPVDMQQYTESLASTSANGVISGMTASASGTPDTYVHIASGVVRVNGTIYTFASQTDVDFTNVPDVVNPKKCLIVVTSAGSITHRDGTAAAAAPAGEVRRLSVTPDPPVTTAGDVVLCEVWIPAGDSTPVITSTDISDRRITVRRFERANAVCVGYGSVTATSATIDILDYPWENLIVKIVFVGNSGIGTGDLYLRFQSGVGASSYHYHTSIDNGTFGDATNQGYFLLSSVGANGCSYITFHITSSTSAQHYAHWEGGGFNSSTEAMTYLRGSGVWTVQNSPTQVYVAFNGTGTPDLIQVAVYGMPKDLG